MVQQEGRWRGRLRQVSQSQMMRISSCEATTSPSSSQGIVIAPSMFE